MGDRPFFLFVNYFDPHTPYDPPAGYADRERLEPDLPPGMIPEDVRARVLEEGERLPARIAEYYLALYEGEMALVDRHLQRLLERLRSLGYVGGR